MKYILKRNQILKESFLNPDKDDEKNVEWEDTLIGSLLNRIYGSSKNKLKRGKLNRLADKLDAAIARIFILKAKQENEEEVQHLEEDAALVTTLEIIDDMPKILEYKKYELMVLHDKIKEVTVILNNDGGNSEILSYLNDFGQILLNRSKEADRQNSNLIEHKEYTLATTNGEIEIFIDSIDGDVVTYHNIKDPNNKLSTKTKSLEIVDEDTLKMIETSDVVDAEHKELPSDEDLKKVQELVKNYNNNKENVEKNININPDYKNAVTFINKVITEDINKFDKQQILLIIEILEFILNPKKNKELNINNTIDKIDDKTNESNEYITKTGNIDKTILTSNINKAKDLIRERRKNYKFNKEEIEKIDSEVRKSADNIVNGNDLREVVNILEMARQDIISNDYEALRKKQKRYYIPLSGGLAIHKASYDAWARRVQNIVAYYKDLLPEKFSAFLLETLNYNGEINAYTDLHKIIKKYLGFEVDIKNHKNNQNQQTNNKDIHKTTGQLEETTSKRLKFTDIGSIRIELYKPFILEGNSTSYTLLPIHINDKSKIVIFKYKTDNVNWLGSYYNEDDVKIDSSKVKNEGGDNKPVRLLYMEYPKDLVIKKYIEYDIYTAEIANYTTVDHIKIKVHNIYAVFDKQKLANNTIDLNKTKSYIFKQENSDNKKYSLHNDSIFGSFNHMDDIVNAINNDKNNRLNQAV